MNIPETGDYIDIHNHDAQPCIGYFQIDNLMAHEKRTPGTHHSLTYSIGIHPWFLTAGTLEQQLSVVNQYADHQNIIALGETGFDKLKGPEKKLQHEAFEAQVRISERVSKPLFIHCVRAWDELLSEQRKLKPATPWIVHGFRGKRELAMQLISKGMYLSFWFDFIIRPEATSLLKNLPKDKIFLETDGSDIDIERIYEKAASDLTIPVDELKETIFSNFKNVFLK